MTSVFSFFYDTCFPFFKATIVIIPFDHNQHSKKSSRIFLNLFQNLNTKKQQSPKSELCCWVVSKIEDLILLLR